MSGSNLFGELRRMARTSGAVGGIAARVAGERMFGIKTDRASHAEDLRTILGGLKGPLMKVAQFLSTVPDALPAEYAAELAQLQANAPPMGWNFVRRRMASELGPGLAVEVRQLRPRSGGGGQSRPGASRTAARRHRRRLQAAVSRHAEHGRGRSSPAASGDGDLSPHGQRHPARGGLQGTDRTPARGTRLRARGRAYAALRPDAGERSDGACAGADQRPLHAAPADDDLARWPAADAASCRGPAAGGAQPHRRGAVPRLVRAVLPLRRDPRRSASRQLPGAAGCAR